MTDNYVNVIMLICFILLGVFFIILHYASHILRDIKTEKPSLEELTAWYKASGLPLKRFYNTSGKLYKELNLKDKIPTMSEEEQLELLASDGMLVKRPILVKGEDVLIGFKQAEYEAKGL